MSFAQPYFFALALFVVVLLPLFWWANWQRRRALQQLGNPKLISRLLDNLNTEAYRWQSFWWFVALLLLVVMMTRPQWGSSTQETTVQGSSIMVILDISKSMLATDVLPNRLTQAKFALNDLLQKLDGDEVGLVVFAGDSLLQVPITTDYAALQTLINSARPQNMSRQGSALGKAIETALNGFNWERSTQKSIVILSDGENPLLADQAGNIAADPSLKTMLDKAVAQQIRIYTFGIGTTTGAPVLDFDSSGQVVGTRQNPDGSPAITRLVPETLKMLAQESKGQYWQLSSNAAEVDQLAQAIQNLQKSTITQQVQLNLVERFQLFGLLALVILSTVYLAGDPR
jgi:Ca-activated chloride channel family protein